MQQAIQLYIYAFNSFFLILFHYSLLYDIEYSSLYYTVNLCYLYFIFGSVHLLITYSNLGHPFPLVTMFVSYVCESVSVL